MIKYLFPRNWISYDSNRIAQPLIQAKAAVLSLTRIPYQRSWVDQLQVAQLKMEVAGTSRIEGADFTENEFDAAMRETPEQLYTRSQKQVAAAKKAYGFIEKLPKDRPIDEGLIKRIHTLIIVGADDDHCPPGKLRGQDVNVHFGLPAHRGVEGGAECERAFTEFSRALQHEFRAHDPLVQALAMHYHFAAMHPFEDGNGRTARALESLMLQRNGLSETLFIAMSNYYYDEKPNYLKTLTAVRAASHDLTEFIIFGLKGIELQCTKLFDAIKKNVAKALYRNTMFDLFERLKSERKRVIAKRQVKLLKLLLEVDYYGLAELADKAHQSYANLKNPTKALIRDLNYLISLGAISWKEVEKKEYHLFVRLEWPTEITEKKFWKAIKEMPKAKTLRFPS